MLYRKSRIEHDVLFILQRHLTGWGKNPFAQKPRSNSSVLGAREPGLLLPTKEKRGGTEEAESQQAQEH